MRRSEADRSVNRGVDLALKPGKDAPVGTSGTETQTDTTGLSKLNPWYQDLKLQEVEVTSFRASSP